MPTQKESNPFPFSDSNKRYHTYNYYIKHTFGTKCAKLPIDAGMTCPNIDGTSSVGGCIYCSDRGSGDFANAPTLSIKEQIRAQKNLLSHKWDTSNCIAYFQAHTNTYAPVEHLKRLFEEALSEEGIVGLNIATRADCLPDDVVEYLAELATRTHLTVELGLQTASDETAARINRGHTYADFCRGYERLTSASPSIDTCIHIILGLPGESREEMLETVKKVAFLHPRQVKIHLLHVLRGTPMAELFTRGDYVPLTQVEYVDLVCDALELLPEDIVIARLTGDGPANALLAPLWSRNKKQVINDIDKELYRRDSRQGERAGKR